MLIPLGMQTGTPVFAPSTVARTPVRERGLLLGALLVSSFFGNAIAAFMAAAAGNALTEHAFILSTHNLVLKRLLLRLTVVCALKAVLVMGIYGWKRWAVLAYAALGVVAMALTARTGGSPIFGAVGLLALAALILPKWHLFE